MTQCAAWLALGRLQHQTTAGVLTFANFKRELAEYFVATDHGAARPPGEKIVGMPDEMSLARPVREARLAFALLIREQWPEFQSKLEGKDRENTGQVCALRCCQSIASL